MAIGRQDALKRVIARAPRRGPQSTLNELLLGDVVAWTKTHRAAELAAFSSSVSRTYFGAYRPGTAQRIPPLISTGYGAQYADSERIRATLVARAALLRSSLVLNQGATVKQVSAPVSQAARIAAGG